jgi:hypothetical protein
MSDYSLFASYADRLEELPDKPKLGKSDLLTDTLKIQAWSAFEMYYAPFDYLNEGALVSVVGITPGWPQMEVACRIARDGLRSGDSIHDICQLVKREASFVGSMRRNLVEMLDEIGLPERLKIKESRQLFESRIDLIHPTSAIRYPTFYQQVPYTGYKPRRVARDNDLLGAVETWLGPELDRASRSLVVPLGPAVDEAIRHLVALNVISSERCLVGFPHPSDGPGRNDRILTFKKNRDELRRQCRVWLSAV